MFLDKEALKSKASSAFDAALSDMITISEFRAPELFIKLSINFITNFID